MPEPWPDCPACCSHTRTTDRECGLKAEEKLCFLEPQRDPLGGRLPGTLQRDFPLGGIQCLRGRGFRVSERKKAMLCPRGRNTQGREPDFVSGPAKEPRPRFPGGCRATVSCWPGRRRRKQGRAEWTWGTEMEAPHGLRKDSSHILTVCPSVHRALQLKACSPWGQALSAAGLFLRDTATLWSVSFPVKEER